MQRAIAKALGEIVFAHRTPVPATANMGDATLRATMLSVTARVIEGPRKITWSG
jgi:hypothetical protein